MLNRGCAPGCLQPDSQFGSPEPVQFESKSQSFCQPIKDGFKFLLGQFSELTLQFHGRDRSDPLYVEGALLQKCPGNPDLPAVAAQRSGMSYESGDREFVVLWGKSQNNAGADFGLHAQVSLPDFTGSCDGHLLLPFGPYPGTFHLPLRAGIGRHSPVAIPGDEVQ